MLCHEHDDRKFLASSDSQSSPASLAPLSSLSLLYCEQHMNFMPGALSGTIGRETNLLKCVLELSHLEELFADNWKAA
jgi:hypothetical protein